MRYRIPRLTPGLAVAAIALAATAASAQTPAATSASPVRRLSMDDAVKLSLEQNLGIQIDRINPQILDLSVAQAQGVWVPNLTSTFNSSKQNSQPSSSLAGALDTVVDTSMTTQLGINQFVKQTGASYSFAWNSGRATSNNFFNNYEPSVTSNIQFQLSQPLLKNFKIDTNRQILQSTRKDRDAADIQLHSTIVSTTRNVKNAYWDLAYTRDNLKAQQQSLDLAKRLLADNEKRVQIGTMAPIDIVEAQSEVARNEESVIVAESQIRRAEDLLRSLIYDPATTPDFWELTIEPIESMPFTAQSVDVNAAVQRALGNRTDVQLSKNSLAKTDISVKYYKNQAMPEVNAQMSYRSNALGGTLLSPVTNFTSPGPRSIISSTAYGTVLGDVLASQFPTWTFGINVIYPVGDSTAESNLARTRLQYSQAETQLKNLELQIATQVRDSARQVTTNAKRVDSARAARELAERRLDAEEKKFAAGIQTSFFVFQAQRDLSQARTNEVRGIADYNKSVVDFEAIQEAPR